MNLKAPREYDQLSEKERKELLNQCGPDGPLNQLIPDHLLGLPIHQSCDRHDFMFARANTADDFRHADQVFLENMNRQIEHSSSGWLKAPRRILAWVYYGAVRLYSTIKIWSKSEKTGNRT